MERRTQTAVLELDARAPSAPRTESEALQAALERIVFLECRVDQVEAAASAERAADDRARHALAQAAARAADGAKRLGVLEATLATQRAETAELARRLGASEAARAALEAELHGKGEGLAAELVAARRELAEEKRRGHVQAGALDDARARVDSLTGARERLFGKLVEWQRLASGTEAEVDLAELIAELRAEIVHLEHARRQAEAREAVLRLALVARGGNADDVLAGAHAPAAPAAPAQAPGSRLQAPEGEAPAQAPGSRLQAPAGEAARSSGADASSAAPAASGSAAGAPSVAGAWSLESGASARSAAAESGASARSAALATAARFAGEGRLGILPADVEAALADLPTAAEREVARRLAAEVANGPDRLRLRAAVRLVELAGRRAASVIASAAGACADREVRAALVEQLGRSA